MTLLALILALQTVSQPVSIPVQNPSFELPTNLPDSNACGQSTWRDMAGWKFTQQAGGGYGVIAWTCETPPDGKQVAFLLNASASQDLGFQPKVGVYVLKLWEASWYYSYPGNYSVSLTIGGKPICTTSGWARGDFDEITLVCPMPGHLAIDHFNFPVGNLGITLSNSMTGWPTLFDNVSLTFTPTN